MTIISKYTASNTGKESSGHNIHKTISAFSSNDSVRILYLI
jgi:hypothetical protein